MNDSMLNEDWRIRRLQDEIRSLRERLANYGRMAMNTPPNTAMLLGAALSGGDALALAKKLDKPGTHCSVCGEPIDGKPHPGADVTHGECAMEATKELRVGPEADRRRKGREV